MSNRKVREQLERINAKSKAYEEYKKKASLVTDYQICKAYFHDPTCSILCLVEKILKEKYNLPWQEKFIRMATMEARGKTNAVISIPKFKFEDTSANILAKYVKRHFNAIIDDQKENDNRAYPFMLRDIIEKHS